MYEKTMICLANSRKPPSGRCVAGKMLEDGVIGAWLRPVSARPSREVSEEERRYQSGCMAQLLDIIEVPLSHPSPFDHQVENHTLDENYYWQKRGVATWDQVLSSLDPYDNRFWANSMNTYHGLNDKVAAANVAAAGSSLKLIRVEDLSVRIQTESGYEGNADRRRARAEFTYNGNNYIMSLTDPVVADAHLRQGDGVYEVGSAALCVSLVEVWNNFAFRVVASVITEARCEAAATTN